MTITEFLNARYDEEEAAVHKWWTALDRDEKGVPAWIINAGGLIHPVRVLADIAAKRALLQWLDQIDREVDQEGLERYRLAGDFDTDPARRMLAQPFAEHADFDPAWRA